MINIQVFHQKNIRLTQLLLIFIKDSIITLQRKSW